jgi:photosystem II PsbZ protein
MFFIFQIIIFALITLSFVLVVAVPVVFADPRKLYQYKGLVLSRTSIWFLLVFVVGVLNSFVVLLLFFWKLLISKKIIVKLYSQLYKSNTQILFKL